MLVALCVACALASACWSRAWGRRTLALEAPTQAAPTPTRGTVAIASVVDGRHFENDPDSPSTPSIDGDVAKAPSGGLKMMIGRQRHYSGLALGDIALAKGATVETETRTLIAEGLKRRGYVVGEPPTEGSLSVEIEEFWAWLNPEFGSVVCEARIKTKLVVTKDGATHELTVSGGGLDRAGVANDENWQLAYARAFEEYLENLEGQLASVGL